MHIWAENIIGKEKKNLFYCINKGNLDGQHLQITVVYMYHDFHIFNWPKMTLDIKLPWSELLLDIFNTYLFIIATCFDR